MAYQLAERVKLPAHEYADEQSQENTRIPTPSATCGLNPIAAVFVAFWYSFTAAAAMSNGFAYLYKGGGHTYEFARHLMGIVGIGIGIGIAVCLVRRLRLQVGIISSVLTSGLMLSRLLLGGEYAYSTSEVYVFGFRPSATQYLTGIAALTLLSGLLGTIVGRAIRKDESLAGPILGIRSRHWFWLWMAVFGWVAVLPAGIYFLWLEIICSGYVLIHPSLWFRFAWMEGWITPMGITGFAAIIYGIQMSIRNVSAGCSSHVRTRKRVLLFLLGTVLLVGPVANALLRLASFGLEHVPDGITASPWWILR